MKEAVGEGAMTIITITLVSATIGVLCWIIGTLLSNQNKRANCENAGYYYSNNKCYDYNNNEVTNY